MPRYLIQAAYMSESAKGLMADSGVKRRDVAAKAIAQSAGGKLESFHVSFGKSDAIVIFGLRDNVSAAAAAWAVNPSGVVKTASTVRISSAEVDEAAKKSFTYRAARR